VPWLPANNGFKSLGRTWKRPPGFAQWPLWLRGARQRGTAWCTGAVVAGEQRVQIPELKMEKATGFCPVAFMVAGGGFEPPTFGL
jgi:hypothetical protein